MRIIFLAFAFSCLVFPHFLAGQTLSPQLLCVSNGGDNRDTLRYEIPNLSCGDPLEIHIYQSENETGPYAVVDTIQNLSLSSYRVTNSDNRDYFYYLVLISDCMNNTSPPSDTISNQFPPLVNVRSVSVENGETIIRWEDSSTVNSKIEGYIIYRVGTGTLPIDTISAPADQYIDPNSAANLQSEFYYVQAIDGCQLTGGLGNNPHNTIFLQDSVSPCQRTAYLQWNPYSAWDSVQHYVLYVSENGGPHTARDTVLPGTTPQTEIAALDGSINYNYYIEAVRWDDGIIARSNAIQKTPNIIQGVRDLNLWAASIDIDNEEIALQWEWNIDAEIEEAQLLQNAGDPAYSLDALLNPLSAFNSFRVPAESVASGPQSFFIRTVDACDSVRISDTVQTAFVDARSLPSFEYEVSLTYPETADNVALSVCRLLKFRNGTQVNNFQLDRSENQFTESFELNEGEDEEICYQMECTATVQRVNGDQESIQILSNKSCPSREVKVQMPNAFRPRGQNPVFRPLILFENGVTDYELQIYDRWGQQLFSTTEVGGGWDGTIESGQARTGVYVYHLQIQQREGPEIIRKGTVTLLR